MTIHYATWDEVGWEIMHRTADISTKAWVNLTPEHQAMLLNEISAKESESQPLSFKPDGYEMKAGDGKVEQLGGRNLWMMRGWWSDRPKQGWIVWGGTVRDHEAVMAQMLERDEDGII